MITYTKKDESFQIHIALIGHLSESNIMAIIAATESYLLNTDLPINFTIDCTQLTTRLNYVNKKNLSLFFNSFSAERVEKVALIYTKKQLEAVETALLRQTNESSSYSLKPFLSHNDANEWLALKRDRRFLSFQNNNISTIQTETESSEIIAGTNSDIFSAGILQEETNTLTELKEEKLLIEEDLNAASEELEKLYEESVHAEGAFCSHHDESLINLEEYGHEEIFSSYNEESELPNNTILFAAAQESTYEIELIEDPYEKYFSAVS